MPLYEYACPACLLRFEMIKAIDERDEVVCPNCKGKVEKRVSVVNNSFGWRLTEASHDHVLRQNLQGGKDKIERNI